MCAKLRIYLFLSFFFFNDTATTEIYTLSLHDALPILSLNSTSPPPLTWTSMKPGTSQAPSGRSRRGIPAGSSTRATSPAIARSEEHTSELQSRLHLVCRLLLEKKKYYLACCNLDHSAL